MNIWMDGWMDGWMKRWMDEMMNGWIYEKVVPINNMAVPLQDLMIPFTRTSNFPLTTAFS